MSVALRAQLQQLSERRERRGAAALLLNCEQLLAYLTALGTAVPRNNIALLAELPRRKSLSRGLFRCCFVDLVCLLDLGCGQVDRLLRNGTLALFSQSAAGLGIIPPPASGIALGCCPAIASRK